jgi:hypothetical protein
VPNPAHAQFIAREASDPVEETRALSETRGPQFDGAHTGKNPYRPVVDLEKWV